MDAFLRWLQNLSIPNLLPANCSLPSLAVFGLLILFLALVVRNVLHYWTRASRSASQPVGTGADDASDWDWFGPNKPKLQYQECLVDSPENTSQLKVLLRERALEILRRLRKIDVEKESLGKLYKNGSISQTMWESLKRAENGAQLEIFEIQAEADTFEKGWGEKILREAAETLHHSESIVGFLKEMKKANPAIKIPETEEGRKMLAKRMMQEMKRKGAV